MTGRVWLHDSGGAWLNGLCDAAGMLIADIAHAPGVDAPVNSIVRIEGVIERGQSLTTIWPIWWTVHDVELEIQGAPDMRVELGVMK